MKLSNLLALPFAATIDALTLGQAGVTRSLLNDERNQRQVEAVEAVAKLAAALKKPSN